MRRHEAEAFADLLEKLMRAVVADERSVWHVPDVTDCKGEIVNALWKPEEDDEE